MEEFKDLIKMKPSRKKPCEGDIFVIQPLVGQYFYGKVIRTNLPNEMEGMRGWNLIYIYKKMVQESVPSAEWLDPEQILIPPMIVNNQGWIQGYFLTLASVKVAERDFVKNYGFWDSFTKQFLDEEGKLLGYEPIIWTDYGIGSYGSVGYDVQKALMNNSE